MKRFSGRVCLVTASTQGIGYAIAERFAKEGGKVFVSSRKDEAVKAAVTKLQPLATAPSDIAGCVCHVNKADHRKALLERVKETFGPIDVLVLNAASSTHFGDTLSTSAKAFDAMFETNVRSTFLFAQEVQPYLAPSKFVPGGFSTNLLIVASIAGYVPCAPIGIYGVTKTALIGLTKVLAQDYAATGVRVNCLAPGVIRTNFSSLLVDAFEAKQTQGAAAASPPPSAAGPVADATSLPAELTTSLMNRVGEPHEMGAVASFLCSADASFITGEVTVASGGTPGRL